MVSSAGEDSSSNLSPIEVVQQLIREWSLEQHPEGGWFRELYRSPSLVTRADGQQRAAITSILYLLDAGSRSRWHAVHHADEVWTHLQGTPLSLWTLEPKGETAVQHVLSMHNPVHVVPAGHWMAARSEGQYSLVSCCVGPGFDFADFEMLRDRPASQQPSGALSELI